MKTCSRCKTQKPEEEFYKAAKKRGGLHSWCKICSCEYAAEWKEDNREQANSTSREWCKANKNSRKASTLRHEYGLEPEDFAQILLNQQNKCVICNETFKDTPQVDHDHNTGKVRGLLCKFCNQGVGMFKDSPARLIAAAAYLQKTP